jgi:signal transduction histidine kinase
VSTEAAREAFGLHPGAKIQDSQHEWLRLLYDEALSLPGQTANQVQKKAFQWFMNGSEHFFQPHASPVLDAGFRTTGVLLSFKDVTQQRQHDDMKRGLISTVSHQLKTPLTSIRMAIHLLLEEKVGMLTEKQTELLLAARDDSDRLNTILEDLLDIGRMESGTVPLCLEAISPQALAAEALGRFAVAYQDKGVTLNMQVPDNLPGVLADKTRIGHVFDNLLSNALTYTMPGGVVTIAANAGQELVVITVTDTGCGIPREYLDKIFNQFFRAPNQEGTGAGLGLAIAREIVRAHGGTITASSTEGEGTIFTVALKRADNASDPRRIS